MEGGYGARIARRPGTSRPRPLFPQLAGGHGALDRDKVAEHQRARLQGAMVAAVARRGYARTTIEEIVALAGVSRSTLYAHYAGKQELYFATFDVIVGEGVRRVAEAYGVDGTWEERLRAAFDAFMELVVEQREPAHLVLAESLALGATAAPYRERVIETFERMVQAPFAEAGSSGEVPARAIRAIVTGTRRVVYLRLREGKVAKLPVQGRALQEWALAYQRYGGWSSLPAPDNPASGASGRGTAAESSWVREPDPPADRARMSQRERILQAVAWLTVRDGYAALTIPAITAAAGVSNHTFYENFPDKEEALLGAFGLLAERAVEGVTRSFREQPSWREGVAAGMCEILEILAAEPVLTRLALVEVPAAGRVALDRADALLNGFAALLQPDPDEVPAAPSCIGEAMVGAIWSAIQVEVMAGRIKGLPSLSDEIAHVVIAPIEHWGSEREPGAGRQ